MVRHGGGPNHVKPGFQEESPGIVIDILEGHSRRTSLEATVAVEAIENFSGYIIGRFELPAEHSIKQD
jgi:hypothetical protein